MTALLALAIVAVLAAAPPVSAWQPPEPPAVQQEAPAPAPTAAPPPRAPSPLAAGPAARDAAPAEADQGSARRRPPSGGTGGADPQAVPRSRPREGRPVVGQATRRTLPPVMAARPVYVYRAPQSVWYAPYGYGAFGLGYFYYDPWAWSPYGWYGPYGYYPRWAGPYGYEIGAVRLRVTPRDAEVFVDGYYAGIVDDFDGVFQSLKLDVGSYRIEIRKPGYQPLVFDVRVQHGRTITFRGQLVPAP